MGVVVTLTNWGERIIGHFFGLTNREYRYGILLKRNL
jgi:hypothetical protein